MKVPDNSGYTIPMADLRLFSASADGSFAALRIPKINGPLFHVDPILV